VSFSVGKLERNNDSAGVNVGYGPDNNTSPGTARDYLYYADSAYVGSATIADMAGENTQKRGLYGALIVAPKGATFTDPTTTASVDIGARVDVHVDSSGTGPRQDYRDFSLLMADNDLQIGQDFMPYPTNAIAGASNINYATAPTGDSTATFHTGSTDPATPVLKAYVGDREIVHEIVAPGSEQGHVFSLGGLVAPRDRFIPWSEHSSNQALGPGESFDAEVVGGAGGGKIWSAGDYFYGDLRRPFTQIGLWGLQRVLPVPADCARVGSGNPACLVGGVAPPAATAPTAPTVGTATAGNGTATVTWTPPADDGGAAISGYSIAAVDGAGATVGTATAAGTATSGTVTGLTNGTSYRLKVTATNSVGTGPDSALSNPVTPATVSGAPTIGTAASGVTSDTVVSATAAWTAPTSNGGSPVTGYRVTADRYSGLTLVSSALWPATLPAGATSLKWTGLASGATYKFRVRAVNAVGTSAFSASSNLVTAR
jgi:hypothetical protein